MEYLRFFLRVLITVIGLTPSTRAVSRMPLLLSAMSIICPLDLRQPPDLVILQEEDPPLTVDIIAPVPLFAIGLPSVAHNFTAPALRTLHCYDSHLFSCSREFSTGII
jgi:hypothetical protein